MSLDQAARAVVVPLPGSGALADLLNGCPANLVFSNAEHRLCQRRSDLTGWGGRLAAKLSVCGLLGVHADRARLAETDLALNRLEILPEPRGLCGGADACFTSHPPQVVLDPQWAASANVVAPIRVSISHTRMLAVALAAGPAGRDEGR